MYFFLVLSFCPRVSNILTYLFCVFLNDGYIGSFLVPNRGSSVFSLSLDGRGTWTLFGN